jgi:hypothetical protein
MTTVKDLLRSIAGSGELVSLVYNAGSRPGQARSVVPMSISADDLVAVEPDGTKKTYKLSRVAAVTLSNGLCATNAQAAPPLPELPAVPIFGTLAEYAEHFRPELAGAGWHIYEESNSFGIATRFKNGKPKKTPCILVSYFDPSTATEFDMDTGEQRTVARQPTGFERPWRIDSWRFKEGKTVREVGQAFTVFMAEARASDPTSTSGA